MGKLNQIAFNKLSITIISDFRSCDDLQNYLDTWYILIVECWKINIRFLKYSFSYSIWMLLALPFIKYKNSFPSVVSLAIVCILAA
jgi:hypothetical protein